MFEQIGLSVFITACLQGTVMTNGNLMIIDQAEFGTQGTNGNSISPATVPVPAGI